MLLFGARPARPAQHPRHPESPDVGPHPAVDGPDVGPRTGPGVRHGVEPRLARRLAGFHRDPNLLNELAKHGLGEADLHGSINFFSKVAIDDRAALSYAPDHAARATPSICGPTRTCSWSSRPHRTRCPTRTPRPSASRCSSNRDPSATARRGARALEISRGSAGMTPTSTPSSPPATAALVRLKAGERLRIVDLHGNQAVDTLFYAADDVDYRYSAAARSARRATSTSHRLDARSTGRRRARDDHRRHLRPARHPRRRVLAGDQRRPLRRAHPPHARLPQHVPARRRSTARSCKRDLGHNMNFFMNVPLTPDGGLQLRRRHLRAGQATSSSAPSATCSS